MALDARVDHRPRAPRRFQLRVHPPDRARGDLLTAPIDLSTDHETFYGPWDVAVVSSDDTAIFFSIRGSGSADGAYPGAVGETVAVSGEEWVLTVGLQAVDGELLVGHLRRSATVDPEHGLLVEIHATVVTGFEFVALTLELRCRDPTVNPHPTHPPELSFPEGFLVE